MILRKLNNLCLLKVRNHCPALFNSSIFSLIPYVYIYIYSQLQSALYPVFPLPSYFQGMVMVPQNRDICNASSKLRNQVHENFSISVSVTSYPAAGRGSQGVLRWGPVSHAVRWNEPENRGEDKRGGRWRWRGKPSRRSGPICIAKIESRPKRFPHRGGRAWRSYIHI